MDYIARVDCRFRRVYELYSRNLLVGVYDGRGGFIGIREKLGSAFLFTEIHVDGLEGRGWGTVRPLRDLGVDVPNEVPLRLYTESRCSECDRPASWTADTPGGRVGTWRHEDGTVLDGVSAVAVFQPLFDFLLPLHERVEQTEVP